MQSLAPGPGASWRCPSSRACRGASRPWPQTRGQGGAETGPPRELGLGKGSIDTPAGCAEGRRAAGDGHGHDVQATAEP
jgi:hypothetical protein